MHQFIPHLVLMDATFDVTTRVSLAWPYLNGSYVPLMQAFSAHRLHFKLNSETYRMEKASCVNVETLLAMGLRLGTN